MPAVADARILDVDGRITAGSSSTRWLIEVVDEMLTGEWVSRPLGDGDVACMSCGWLADRCLPRTAERPVPGDGRDRRLAGAVGSVRRGDRHLVLADGGFGLEPAPV